MIRASNVLLVMEHLGFETLGEVRAFVDSYKCPSCKQPHIDPVMGLSESRWILACPTCSGEAVRQAWALEAPSSWVPDPQMLEGSTP